MFYKSKKQGGNIFESFPVRMVGERGRELDIGGSSVHLKKRKIINF
jgi:hypothetical protein